MRHDNRSGLHSCTDHRQQSQENHTRGKKERKPSLECPTLQCSLGTSTFIRRMRGLEFEKTLHRSVAARRPILEKRSTMVAGPILLEARGVRGADLSASHADRRQHPGSHGRLVRFFHLTCHGFNGAMEPLRGKPATGKNRLIRGLRTSESRLVRVSRLFTLGADSDAFSVVVVGFESRFGMLVRSNGGAADGAWLPDDRR